MATIDTSWHPVAVPDTGGSAFLSYSSALRDSANKLLENVVSQRQKDRELKQAELRDKLANDLAVAKLEQDAKQNAMTNLLKAFEIDNTAQYNADRLKLLQDNTDLKSELLLTKALAGAGRGGAGGSGSINLSNYYKIISDAEEKANKVIKGTPFDFNNKSLKPETVAGLGYLKNNPNDEDLQIDGVPAFRYFQAVHNLDDSILLSLNDIPVNVWNSLTYSNKDWAKEIVKKGQAYARTTQAQNAYSLHNKQIKAAEQTRALVERIKPWLVTGYVPPKLLEDLSLQVALAQGFIKEFAEGNTTGTTTTKNDTNSTQNGNGVDILNSTK